MKKLLALVVVLAFAAISSATTISLVGPKAGEPGSKENPLQPSQIIVVPIVVDAGLMSMDAIVRVDGLGSIAGATDVATGVQRFGWDAGFAADTAVTPKSATFAAGNFNGLGVNGATYPRVIGEIVFHCDGKDAIPVKVTIFGNDALGGSIAIDGSTMAAFGLPVEIYQVPEPITMSLLGLGGLFLARRRA